jgi:hypothetical protein
MTDVVSGQFKRSVTAEPAIMLVVLYLAWDDITTANGRMPSEFISRRQSIRGQWQQVSAAAQVGKRNSTPGGTGSGADRHRHCQARIPGDAEQWSRVVDGVS